MQFQVTKRFHAATSTIAQGTVVTETMEFADVSAAEAYGNRVNFRAAALPYHIGGAFADNRNFVMFDMSILDDLVPGFRSIEFGDLAKAA